jgi:hypothetical protein
LSIDVRVDTCLLDAEHVRDSSVIEPFLSVLAGMGEGFFLSDFHAEQSFSDWYSAIISLDPADANTLPAERRREVSSAGLSAPLRESLGRFTRREQDDLVIDAYSIAREGPLRGMQYLLTVLDHEEDVRDDGTEYVRVATLRLDAGEDALNSDEKEALLQSMPLHLYETWRPLMTYLTYGGVPATSSEEVAAGGLRYLYAVNVYSPQVVHHFGRERLLATPGVNIETLSDGGMQVEPWDMAAAAAHLGLRWTVM